MKNIGKIIGFCALLFGLAIVLPAQDSTTQTFRLSNGEELVVELSQAETISGEGQDTVITVGISQRVSFLMNQTFWTREFSGFRLLPKNQSSSPSNLRVYLSQDYDGETNSYSPAMAIFNFRAEGLVLKCKLEAYIVETQRWQKIGILRLKGDSSSDQFHLKTIVSHIRLSRFQLKKY